MLSNKNSFMMWGEKKIKAMDKKYIVFQLLLSFEALEMMRVPHI